MFKITLALFTFVMISVAQAADISFVLMGGPRFNSGSTDLTNASVVGTTAFQVGALGIIPIQGSFAMRGGFVYTQRNVVIGPTTTGDVDVNLSYIDFPITPMWLFSEYAGAFAGPIIAMNFNKECSRGNGSQCDVTGASSAVFPITVGVHFKFASQMGGEFSYEYVPGQLWSTDFLK